MKNFGGRYFEQSSWEELKGALIKGLSLACFPP